MLGALVLELTSWRDKRVKSHSSLSYFFRILILFLIVLLACVEEIASSSFQLLERVKLATALRCVAFNVF